MTWGRRTTGIIDSRDNTIVHAVMGAARTQSTWIVFRTAYGTTCNPESDKPSFKKSALIATVRYVHDNIVDVTYESDKRVERLYV